MKIISVAVLLSFISVCVYAQPYNKSIDSLIRTYVSLNKFNGNVLITKAGKIVFRGAYGFRDVEANSKCAGKEIFQLASLTKSFTAVLILKLIEEKKLSPDTPISIYFPGIHPDSGITVANLLNHTSGIREVLRDSVLRGKIFAGMKTSQEELISYFSSQPLDFAPGTVFSYSNSGYDLPRHDHRKNNPHVLRRSGKTPDF